MNIETLDKNKSYLNKRVLVGSCKCNVIYSDNNLFLVVNSSIETWTQMMNLSNLIFIFGGTCSLCTCTTMTDAFLISPSPSSLINHQSGVNKIYIQGSSHLHKLAASTKLLLSASQMPRIGDSSIQELAKNGYVIIKDFIGPDLVQALRNDVNLLRSSNKFNIAKIGQDSLNKLNTEIRVAETCFLGEGKLQDMSKNDDAARTQLYNVLNQLQSDLSGNSILDVNDSSNGELIKAAPALDKSLSELLYAYYPKGGFYRRHTDAVQKSASVLRTYSLLIYLNSDWKESDGGCLRIHLDSGGDFLPEGEEPNFIDVEPKAGTLVLFKSDKIPHEVLDTNTERTAVVGWYNRPLSSADIASLASEEDKVRGIMLLVAAGLVTFGVISIITG